MDRTGDRVTSMNPAKEEYRWLTYAEAAAILGCSNKTVQRKVREGSLTAHYYPGKRNRPYLNENDVKALLAPQPAGVN